MLPLFYTNNLRAFSKTPHASTHIYSQGHQ